MSFAASPSASDDDTVMRLPRERSSPSAARCFSRSRLADVVGADTLEDVLLVVSELVSNALMHGSGAIRLQLGFDGALVTGDVSDEGGGFSPHLPERPSAHVGGNGLYLVDQLTERCGVDAGASRVWFQICDRPDRPPGEAVA